MSLLLLPLVVLMLIFLTALPIFPEEKLLWIVAVFIAFLVVVIFIDYILPR